MDLDQQSNTTIIVYPSWARFSYRWEDVPLVVEDPHGSGFLKNQLDWMSFGYPETPDPCVLYDGPFGGGLVAVDLLPPAKWLPAVVLTSEANLRPPSGVIDQLERMPCRVCYLEPRDDRLKRERADAAYLCDIRFHEAEAHSPTQWILEFSSNRFLPEEEDIRQAANGFGLASRALDSAVGSPKLSERVTLVQEITGGPRGIGYHFACAVYTALHFSKTSRRTLTRFHFVSHCLDTLAS